MATRVFRRGPRIACPPLPGGEMIIDAPPTLPPPVPTSVLQLLLPGVMVLGSVGFICVGGLTAASLGMGSLVLLSTIGMLAGGLNGRKAERKASVDTNRKQYLGYLTTVRAELDVDALAHRAHLGWSHPPPAALWSFAGGRRMWERRRADADFAVVRVGLGAQPLSRRLNVEALDRRNNYDPVCLAAVSGLTGTRTAVTDLPVTIDMALIPAIAVGGDGARGLVRAMLLQLAVFHSPDQVIIAVATAERRRPAWDWVKWLPHNQNSQAFDAVGTRRLVAGSLAEIEHSLAHQLSTRSRFRRDAALASGEAHVVIVIDGGAVTGDERLLLEDGLAGVTILDLSDSTGRLASERGLDVRVDDDRLRTTRPNDGAVLACPDSLSVGEADAIARQLAPWRVGASDDRGGVPLLTSAELVDLLGVGDPADVNVATLWRPRAVRDRLRIPIGVGPGGESIELDLKEAALEGMGPHGLVIGATGSGKSELLRTLALGLAMTHSPSAVNMILIDFKGGATFRGLQDLPHTAAVVTNLQDDLSLVDRMHDALAGELNRRQELLRSAGNFASVGDYEQARDNGAHLDPLPSLVIVCDEFTEMLTQKPEFAELFVAIGRLGRSLSMHLVLAAQRLEEGKLRGLDSHLSYRIGLKTFSAAESRAVLGVADAYELPSVPGSGYLKFDVSPLVRFKAAYVSGPYHRDRLAEVRDSRPARLLLPFLSEPVEVPFELDDADSGPTAGRSDGQPRDSVLDVVVEALRGQGPVAREIWLAPLGESPTLDALLPRLHTTPERGLCAADPAGLGDLGGLIVPVGWVDRPYDQLREPLLLDFAGAAGNGVVVGGPRSGKSTVLRNIITSLALTHTPREVQVYGIDLGGGSLAATAGLPHVGSVASRADPNRVRRIIAEVANVLTAREQRFSASGIESIAGYRELRRAGEHGDDPYGEVFLVIDGWASFRAEFDDLDHRVSAIAASGLSFGVHVVIAANRWGEIRPALKDALGTRLELRLGDASESEIDRRVAAAVPPSRPGRGITQQRLHFLSALPRIDARADVTDLAIAAADLVDRVRAAWPGPTAPQIRVLPDVLPYAALPPPDGTRRIPIGVNEDELAAAYLDFDADPHFLFFADGESGKTTLLKTVARGIVSRYSSDDARILLVDYRRTMLGYVPADYLAGYAAAAPALQSFLDDLRPVLQARLPGPDVTNAELRDRSWWTGPEIFVLVDDYDLVASPAGNPLGVLIEFLAQAKDVGVHVVICRRTGGASRALFEPVIQRLRELGSPGIVGSGNRDEGALLGAVRPGPLPSGRGVLVGRRYGAQLIQLAHD